MLPLDRMKPEQFHEGEAADQDTADGGSLTTELVQQHLGVLGKDPYSQCFIYTTATLRALQLTDISALAEFPHLQHVVCAENQLTSLHALQTLRVLLSVDAAHNALTSVLDFDTPQCTPENAWADGAQWLGSLLRRADLSHNRIPIIRDLGVAHPFLQELYLSHNDISELRGIAALRFLRVLDVSHNRLRSTQGLLAATTSADQQGETERDSERASHLEALEVLRLAHNQLTAIDEVTALPRLTELDVAHNQLQHLDSLEHCDRLQRLDLSHNAVSTVNELNNLIPLAFLHELSVQGCPFVAQQATRVFCRARVLRRLQQLSELDGETVSAKEKVKALAMHGSEVASRQRVLANHLPAEQFINYLPTLEYDDDVELSQYYEARYGPGALADREDPSLW